MRRLVHIAPLAASIWPDHQAKALDQAIITRAACLRTAHKLRQHSRLNAAQHAQAHMLHATNPAHDTVKGEALLATPREQEKRPQALIALSFQ